MHLVKEGLLNELITGFEIGEISKGDESWYYGRIMGLLEAGYLTQDEHDDISNSMVKMFEHARKGGD